MEVSRKSSEPLPEIYYIEGTLQMVWVDRCYPGYGMNALIHPDCPECCGKWQIHLSYKVLNTVTMFFALIELSTLLFNFIKLLCYAVLGCDPVKLVTVTSTRSGYYWGRTFVNCYWFRF